jgi:hypothetical protein
MWSVQTESLTGDRGDRYRLHHQNEPASRAQVLQAWQDSATFRTWFNDLLASSPYSAFRWETPAWAQATASLPFEFVILDSPGLARSVEPEAFAEHFSSGIGGVVHFHNLGRDAQLVVPLPVADHRHYGHLAAFVRGAPANQRDQFWKLVGQTLQARLSERPVWLSTAGAGVSWLHVRLDDRPKYYGYAPYRDARST